MDNRCQFEKQNQPEAVITTQNSPQPVMNHGTVSDQAKKQFEYLGTTDLKQIADIVEVIVKRSNQVADQSQLKIELGKFDCKHTHDFAQTELFGFAFGICKKLEEFGYLVSVLSQQRDVIKESTVTVDVSSTYEQLIEYKQLLDDEIYHRVSLEKSQAEQPSFSSIDHELQIFHLLTKHGKTISIPFAKNLDRDSNMFIVFSVLYRHWARCGSKPVTSGELIEQIKKKKPSLSHISDRWLDNTIHNVRDKKFSRGFSKSVSFDYDRKAKGWVVSITQPE